MERQREREKSTKSIWTIHKMGSKALSDLVVTQTNGRRPAYTTRRDVSLVCIKVHKTQYRETLKIIACVSADTPCTCYLKK
jgi:hypothetical protein